MKQPRQTPESVHVEQPPLTPEARQERKQRVLTKGTPSVTRSIADAVVIKDDNLYFLTTRSGGVPVEGGHGFGLYYRDCRYLRGYDLRLAGSDPAPLVATAQDGYVAVFELTNHDLHLGEGLTPKDTLGITWTRSLDGAQQTLFDQLTFKNLSLESVEVPVTFTFSAGFEDVFTVRELLDERPGDVQAPAWSEGALNFIYAGVDGLYRSVCIFWSPQPDSTDGSSAHYRLKLAPRATAALQITVVLTESPEIEAVRPAAVGSGRRQPPSQSERGSQQWRSQFTQIESDSLLLNRLFDRSLLDLHMLRSHIGPDEFFAAGVPWFTTLFGRDSAITALQTLAYNPAIAAQTLRLLASYQGQRVDDWRDEQPGKILHELRVGELARAGEIPHTPYYGTVDATPLFLILLGQHAAWTGDLSLFEELREPVERALNWIDEYGDSDGDGYIEYQSLSEQGLINQGWKDSGDAIVAADGSLARPPISLVELQGYVYAAKLNLADLYARTGESERAQQLRRQAEGLREKFNRDFWLEDLGCYALALQADGQPAAVISSNPGHALWSAIADADKARRTVARLMAEDMFTGWGIRTLSDQERRYNPIGYHLGTVWPHENSLIAAGFRLYGHDDEAMRVFTGMVEAAMYFEAYRLPELFAGFRRETYGLPVRYPVACHPQAWSAGSVPYFMAMCLGFRPQAFERRLSLVRPLLPLFVDRVEVRGLRVGQATAHLRLTRTAGYQAEVEVVDVKGELDVVVEA